MSQASKRPTVNKTVGAVALSVKSSGQTASSLPVSWTNSSEELPVEKNPFLEMSQDQIQKLDAVLSSEQAKLILSETSVQFGLPEPKLDEVLENEVNKEALNSDLDPTIDDINYIMTVNQLNDLEPKSDDFLQVFENSNEALTGTGSSGIPKDILEDDLIPVFSHNHLENILLDHCYSMLPGTTEPDDEARNANVEESEELEENDSYEIGSGKKIKHENAEKNGQLQSPVRRSQRQIEKIEREQLEKIRAENAELQRREKEEMERLKLLQEKSLSLSNSPEDVSIAEQEAEESEVKNISEQSVKQSDEESEKIVPITPKGRGRGRGRGRGKFMRSDEPLSAGKGRGRAKKDVNEKESTPSVRGKVNKKQKDNKTLQAIKRTKAESMFEDDSESDDMQAESSDEKCISEANDLIESMNISVISSGRGRKGIARNKVKKKVRKNKLYLSESEDEIEKSIMIPGNKPRKRAGNQNEGNKMKGKKGKAAENKKKLKKQDSISNDDSNKQLTPLGNSDNDEIIKCQVGESDDNVFIEIVNKIDADNKASNENLNEMKSLSDDQNVPNTDVKQISSDENKEENSQLTPDALRKSLSKKQKIRSQMKKKKMELKNKGLSKMLKDGKKSLGIRKKEKLTKHKEKVIKKKLIEKTLKKEAKDVVRKTYPKRENRKPPPHLVEIFEPALFSTPDIMKKVDGKIPGVEMHTPDSTEKLELKFDDSMTSPPITDPFISSTNNLPLSSFSFSKETCPSAVLSNRSNGIPSESGSNEVEEIKNEVSRIMSGIETLENENVSSSLNVQEEDIEIKQISEQLSSSPPASMQQEQLTQEQQSKSQNEAPEQLSNHSLKVLPQQLEQNQENPQVKQGQQVESKSTNNEKPKKQIRRLRTRRRKQKPSEIEISDNLSDASDISYSDDPGDSDWCSEDDPDRLWCVCKQPHNERFMILCDVCKDWFHGTCVGVSRKQGREMEKQGREWICPKCTKEKPKGKEIKLDEKVNFKESKENSKFKDSIENKIMKGGHAEARHSERKEDKRKLTSKPNKISSQREKSSSQQCIVKCGKLARTDSIYCSNECIQKHANESLQLLNKLGKMKTGESRKHDGVRVVVLERSSGKILTGPNAPTEINLRQWLRDHPTFEVLRPGVALPSSKFYNASEKEKKETAAKKEQPSPQPSDKDKRTSTSGPEPIRLNVRKTLKDILTSRSKGADDILLSSDEIRKIVLSIEEELFKLFGDIGSKYKAKYRSLMFNIKDPKNHGLFRKILKGRISPHKLVRMTPDELASKELAKWRERETKHALEIITREQSELQQVPIIKKTHKGEIEIHEDEVNFVEVVPEEKTKTKEETPVETILGTMLLDTTEDHRSHLFDLNCKICTGQMAPPVEEPPQKKAKISKMITVDNKPTVKENIKLSEKRKGDTDKRNHTEKNETEKRVTIATEPPKETVSDREPSSTVISSPDSAMPSQSDTDAMTPRSNQPSVWKGFIVMQEVAKIVAGAYKVSGPTDFLTQDVPDTIQICGRINASVVWDYLSKVKQSGTKEFLVIRFQPANDEEKVAYVSLYHYLSSRKRFGVVGNASKMVKDFYIVPLASHTPVPSTLQPFEGPGLEEPRPHMLLGVLVRHKGHRKAQSTSTSSLSEPAGSVKRSVSFERSELEPSFTPPLETMPKTKSNVSISIASPSKAIKDESSYTPPLDNMILEKKPVVTFSSVDPSDRSYTPPLDKLHQSSNSNADDDSPYSPEKEALAADDDDDDDAPYDPEDNDSGLAEKTTTSNVTSPIFPLISGSVSTQSVSELIDQISKSSNPAVVTTTVLASIATATDIEQQRRLLIELTQKVEEQKHQLEMQKKKIAATVGLSLQRDRPVEKSTAKPEDEEAYSPSYTPPLENESNFSTAVNNDNNKKELNIIEQQDYNNISLPANLQKILENIKKKVSETNSSSSNSLDASQKSKNVILEDPIVKNFAHVDPDDEEKSKSFIAELPLEDSSSSDASSSKKISDPRVKSAGKPADPRLKHATLQDPRRKGSSALSSMSVSELVEKARKQLEDTKTTECDTHAGKASAIPTIVSQSYPSVMECSKLKASYIEPPPPGVEEAEIDSGAAFVPPSLPPSIPPPTPSPYINPMNPCPYPPPPPPPPPSVPYGPPPFPPPSPAFATYAPQPYSSYHNCPPFNEQNTVHERGSHRYSYQNRGRGRGNWHHRDRDRGWQSRDSRNSDDNWHHDHDSRRPRDRDDREHYRDRDERRDRDDRHRDYRDRDERDRIRDKDYRDRERGRDHKSRSRHRD